MLLFRIIIWAWRWSSQKMKFLKCGIVTKRRPHELLLFFRFLSCNLWTEVELCAFESDSSRKIQRLTTSTPGQFSAGKGVEFNEQAFRTSNLEGARNSTETFCPETERDYSIKILNHSLSKSSETSEIPIFKFPSILTYDRAKTFLINFINLVASVSSTWRGSIWRNVIKNG